MKRKISVGLLSAEALAGGLFCILQISFTGAFSTVMAFPFEQIGIGLRFLSLSSGLGNVIAIVIYFAVSLLPIASVVILQKKRKLYAEDGLLVLLSVILFAVLYIMVNPDIITMWTGEMATQTIGKAVLGCLVYSVLCGYFVLRVLRLFSKGKTEKLVRYMSVMLFLVNVFVVYLIFGDCFSGLLNSISALRAGNIGNEHLLGVSYVFLVLQFVVDTLPYAFIVLVVFSALRLLEEMRKDRYSLETVAATGKISRQCKAALVTIVLANIGFNLLQLLLAKSLFIINSSVQIPIFSITLVLAALLLTRLVTENKQLKDDNDMFI